MDRLTSMAVFVSTVDTGSLRGAADRHRLSPSMVAKHIAALEARLGGRLIHRTTRRQGLTALGEAYYARCTRILAEVNDADALGEQQAAAPRGVLRISAPPAFGIHVLTPLLTRFLARHTQVAADLVLTDRKVDLIEESFEVAFRIGGIADEGLVARPLPPYAFVLAASPAYLARAGTPHTPDDLADHELIGFRQWDADRVWPLVNADDMQSVPVRGRLRVDHGEAARRAALEGWGIVLQSRITLAEDLAAGRLVVVLPGFAPPTQPMHLIYLPDRERAARLDAFIGFVLAAFGDPAPAATRP